MHYLLCPFLIFTIASAATANEQRIANQSAMRNAVTALKTHNQKALADLVQYPYRRPKPLSAFMNSEDLVRHYDEYFDERSEREAFEGLEADIRRNSIHGTGRILFERGKIVRIEPMIRLSVVLHEAMKQDSVTLSKVAQNYDEILVDCETEDQRVRIERFGPVSKFFAWKKREPLANMPLSAVTKREDLSDSGSVVYTFELLGIAHRVIDSGKNCSEQAIDPKTGRCRIMVDGQYCNE